MSGFDVLFFFFFAVCVFGLLPSKYMYVLDLQALSAMSFRLGCQMSITTTSTTTTATTTTIDNTEHLHGALFAGALSALHNNNK